mmetsp:Transcript_10284/g.19235  ORF Transcript_10284/g.19235 Transcript_10284/m.19235 type:complete len:225 (+) Transcript_10284:1403-2077(+)
MRKGRTAACGQMRLHLLHCVHLSMSTTGTLIAMPRFSYWLVPKGTRPPGMKVLTGSELPSRLLQWLWICLANCAELMSTMVLGPRGTLVEVWSSPSTRRAAQELGTGHSTMPVTEASTPSMFILTTASPFLPYIFLMLFFSISMASSYGITPLSLKKTLCMIILMRLPRPAFTAICVASMMYNLACFSARSRRILAGRCCSSSAGFQEQLITTTPLGFKYRVMS